MKKRGILNRQLAGEIAALEHKEAFMIADAGMPVPKGVPIIDLAVVGGVPTFRQVMDAVMDETGAESYVLAEEIKTENPDLLGYIQGKMGNLPCTYVPHTEPKKMCAGLKFVIRTGEFSPYPNILIVSDCSF